MVFPYSKAVSQGITLAIVSGYTRLTNKEKSYYSPLDPHQRERFAQMIKTTMGRDEFARKISVAR
jgi:hypothetical protein